MSKQETNCFNRAKLLEIGLDIDKLGKLFCQDICQREYKSPRFATPNERPVEFQFLFKHLANVWPSTVLDVGSGLTSTPQLIANCGFRVTAIDNIEDYWTKGEYNRHYHIINDNIVDTKLTDKFDFLNCVSVLEHIEKHDQAIDSMFSLLKPGGHLVLTFSYCEKEYFENIYKVEGAGYGQNLPYICKVFSRTQIKEWVQRHNAKIVDEEFWQIFNGKYWTFDGRIYPPVKTSKRRLHQLGCFLLRKPQ